MNSDIRDLARWAQANGWSVRDDNNGYTRFYAPTGEYVVRYPATPSNPRRRMADVMVALKRAGLEVPAPSKKELRSRRTKEGK